MTDRSIEELLKGIQLALNAFTVAVKASRNTYSFIPVESGTNYVVDWRENGHNRTADVIGWRINADGSEVKPLTAEGVISQHNGIRP